MAGQKRCPKIILEGTRLTQKTELAFKLNEHPRLVGERKYRYHSPVISAEWCGFTNYPWGRGLINFNPDEYDLAMETYATWCRLFGQLRYYSWIVDRFHLSTRYYQRQAHGLEIDFSELEIVLKELGFHLVLCTRDANTFEAARAERLKVSGNPSQYDDLDTFVTEQEVFRDLARESILPCREVNVGRDSLYDLANEIADWLESTGGLWME